MSDKEEFPPIEKFFEDDVERMRAVSRALDEVLRLTFGKKQAFVVLATGYDLHSPVQIGTNLSTKESAKVMLEETLKAWTGKKQFPVPAKHKLDS